MSPVIWFCFYPAYERMLIVDLNNDTKTNISKVPTGSNLKLSQEQPTKIQSLWVNIPVAF